MRILCPAGAELGNPSAPPGQTWENTIAPHFHGLRCAPPVATVLRPFGAKNGAKSGARVGPEGAEEETGGQEPFSALEFTLCPRGRP